MNCSRSLLVFLVAQSIWYTSCLGKIHHQWVSSGSRCKCFRGNAHCAVQENWGCKVHCLWMPRTIMMFPPDQTSVIILGFVLLSVQHPNLIFQHSWGIFKLTYFNKSEFFKIFELASLSLFFASKNPDW